MYPPYPARQTNFVRDANNGVTSPSAAGVDAELNSNTAIVSQVVGWLRGITNADGTLKNLSSATAQALAGAQRFSATSLQTAFTTTIVWQSTFTALNVAVYVSGVKLDSSAVTVADASGFLRVTIAAQPLSTIVFVAAFESGAGVLTRIGTVGSATDGANLVGIRDAGGYFVATNVETALQEFYAAYAVFIAAVGNTADLIKRTGAVAFTANQSLGGFRLTNVADGVGAQDAVTINQFNAYTAVWNALQTYFLRLDGTTTMSGALAMGSQKITGLANGTLSTDGVNKSQLDLKLSLAGGTMTGAIAMGAQLITGLADGVANTDAVTLQQARSLTASFATKVLYQAPGTSAFVVPAGISKLKVRVWGGGGGGSNAGSALLGYGGGGGAYTEATLSVTPGESITVIVGAGGAVNATGGTTQILRGATVLMSSAGGARGDTTGLGGAYVFDGSVTGFGINGGGGGARYINTGAADPVSNTGGIGGASPNGGAGGRYWIYQPSVGTFGTGGENGDAPGGGGASFVSAAGTGAAGAAILEY